MSLEADKALLRRYYQEVLSQGNLTALDELFAPELAERFRQAVTLTPIFIIYLF